MSHILDHLYIAGVEETYLDENVKSSCTHFLNVALEVMISERVDHEYRKIAIADDDAKSDIREILAHCISYMHDIIQQGGTICVHCMEGKSRSVCVALAYMCCIEKWNLQDALGWIKHKRPCIDIFPLYFDQTCEYIVHNNI